MEYFEEGKTYTFEEIQEVYKNASARELKTFTESVEKSGTNDLMFNSMVTMLCMQTMANLNNTMFSKRVNKENKEN